MPLAIASTMDWVVTVKQRKVMTYSWLPDATFMDRGLQLVLFPILIPEEYKRRYYRTAMAAVNVQKWAHQGLEKAAPRVYASARNMNIKSSVMQEILEKYEKDAVATGEYDLRGAACHFLKTKREIWQAWVPDPTKCVVGQGLGTDEQGDFKCDWCPTGRASVPHPTINSSRICEDCPAGRFQQFSQMSACVPCAPGSNS